MFIQIVGAIILLVLTAIGFYHLRQSRLRHCPHCRRRHVHTLTHRTVPENELFHEPFEYLKRREEDLVSGPAGVDGMIVIVRPMQTIIRPCWLFGETAMQPTAGTVVDSIETETCAACGYQTVKVISRIDENHLDRVAIRQRIAELPCPDCSCKLVWQGDPWHHDEIISPAGIGFVAFCPSCDSEFAIAQDYSIKSIDTS